MVVPVERGDHLARRLDHRSDLLGIPHALILLSSRRWWQKTMTGSLPRQLHSQPVELHRRHIRILPVEVAVVVVLAIFRHTGVEDDEPHAASAEGVVGTSWARCRC